MPSALRPPRSWPLLLLVLFIPMWAQGPNQGAVMRPNYFPAGEGQVDLTTYDGSSNPIYTCSAASIQTGPLHAPTWAITPKAAQLTLTNIVVSANVGTITVSGSTIKLQIGNAIVVAGSATTALNGTYVVQSTPSTTTVTITTSGVSNATFTDANLTVSSTAPRSDDGVWTVRKIVYSSGNPIRSQWAGGVRGGYTNSCDAQTTLVYQ